MNNHKFNICTTGLAQLATVVLQMVKTGSEISKLTLVDRVRILHTCYAKQSDDDTAPHSAMQPWK